MMKNYDYTKEEEQRLKEILKSKGSSICQCGREIDFGDIAWNEACTESGTPLCCIEIECQACDEAIKLIHSWYPAETIGELIDVINDDWGSNR